MSRSGKNGRECSVRSSVTTLADRTIAALRATHDDLAALVHALTDEQLAAPSGASEWTVAHHVSAVLRKLQEPSRSRAVATARRKGMIGPV